MTNENQLPKRPFLLGGAFFLAGIINFPGDIRLSPRQDAIILGNLLGDGHLQLSQYKKSARLRLTHGIAQKDYVNWQYNNLRSLCTTVKEPYETTTKKKYKEFIAYTGYHTGLKPYHDLFYKEK
jgi:hypothetical protein